MGFFIALVEQLTPLFFVYSFIQGDRKNFLCLRFSHFYFQSFFPINWFICLKLSRNVSFNFTNFTENLFKFHKRFNGITDIKVF